MIDKDRRKAIMTLSIVTPIYNDSYLAYDFVKSLLTLKLPPEVVLIEIIFVVDGSGIKDEKEIKKIAEQNVKVKMVALSRNFGQHIAVSAGYAFAKGDLICMINVDQQDPVDNILVLLPHILTGDCDVVYGLRKKRNDRHFKEYTSYIFNILLNKLTGQNIPLNIATIRIMSRRFIDAYNQLSEKSRYLPGLENWLGFPKTYVVTEHQSRRDSKSSYNLSKRLFMAVEAIISFSDLPLRLIAILGFILAITGFILLLVLVLRQFFSAIYQPGYTSTIGIITFIGGVQIFLTGLSAIYVGRILREVQNRPLYIVKETHNF